jgi:two-component system, NtrC family, response regulator
MANILIIDDNETLCEALSDLVSRIGHRATSAFTLAESLRLIRSKSFDIVFLDVKLPDGIGLDLLPTIRETLSSPEVIIMTGSGDPDGAELAIKNGAWDYIEKPSRMEQMLLPLVRALQYREEKKNRKVPVVLNLDQIVGRGSPKMRTCIDLLGHAAGSDANVLLHGETGTGKELFANAIHSNSPRAHHNFVVVDCAALPETLIESMLFGHEKGAFTGADKAREGLVQQADGGTLFLDEVGELPVSLQKAFLRVLQERRFRPVGGKEERDSNFRLIAATNRNLDQMVDLGQFRSDLLFRLRSITIEIPPLREHAEDIPELALYYVDRLCKKYGFGTKGFSPEWIEMLASYPWPGNIRELIYTLERAISVACHEPILFPKHLPESVRIEVVRKAVSRNVAPPMQFPEGPVAEKRMDRLKEVREAAIARAERQYLHEVMAMTMGKVQRACEVSGLSRSRLYLLLSKYGMSKSL